MIYSSDARTMCDSQTERMSKGYVSCHSQMAHIDIEAYINPISIVILPYFLFPITIFSLYTFKSSMRLDQLLLVHRVKLSILLQLASNVLFSLFHFE